MRNQVKKLKRIRRSEWGFFLVTGSFAVTTWFLVTLEAAKGNI